jgi:formiminotetrahydrofolate cyclodeaminase
MNSIWDITLRELRDSTATYKPLATAGSVSIINSVLACSLLVMALEISFSKTKDQRKKRKMSLLIGPLTKKMDELSAFADKDILFFKSFMEAFALPETTKHEKELKVAAIQKNRLQVIGLPLEAAMSTSECFQHIERAAELCHGSFVADLSAATIMLNSSIQSLLWTVQVNTRDLPENELKHFQRERKKLSRSATELSDKILSRVKMHV